jgi:glycerate-2-kinase
MLISGGGSTLICLPKKPMTCADEGTLWSALSAQGASIQDINTVRKHTSPLRGGGLAQAAYPAEVISLIISDVPGNDIGYIASGPTVRDTSTIDDAQAVLARYNIEPRAEYTFTETPKDQKYFERVTNTLFLSNQDALIAIKSEAERRGYTATIMSDHFSGEAREVGLGIIQQLHDAAPHTVLLYGGEATVKLGNTHGNGGRNQEMALAVLTDLHDDELLLPIASDGHDNSDHAGAIADTTTREHAALKHISIEDCFAAHNSYDFFTVTGDALITGYTGSNVSDIIIAIKN